MSPVHDWVLIMRSHCDGLPKRVYTWFLWRFQGDFKLDFIRGRCPLGSTKSRGHRRRKKRVLVTFRTWQFCWSPFWGWWKHDPKSMAICYLQRSGIKRSLCLNHLAWIKATPQLQINLVMFVFFFEKSEKMHGSNILHMIMYFHNFVVSMFEFCWKKSRLKGDGHLVPFHKPSVGFGGLSPGGWLLRFGAPNFHDGVSMGRVRIYLRIYYIRNSHSCGWIYHSHGSVTVVLEYQKVSTPLKTNSQNALKNQWLEDEPFRGHVNFVGGVTPSKCW